MNGRTLKRPAAMFNPPWWLWVMLAGVSYFLLKDVAPDVLRKAGSGGLADFVTYLAPLVTIAFLLLAAFRLYADDAAPEQPGEPDDAAGTGPDRTDRD